MKFKTQLLHTNTGAEQQTGALTIPIYQSSTFSYGKAAEGKARFAGEQAGFIYSRMVNPNLKVNDYRKVIAAAAKTGAITVCLPSCQYHACRDERFSAPTNRCE